MPLITLNANFNVENAQKSTKKSEKKQTCKKYNPLFHRIKNSSD